ncbi:ABC transporter permease [Billgrantia gudaonensis]|uniref:Cu-processing system permease protein n=1 Tax=Billgrantia gudaonensis TaxID=376427 RepID=A0A1G8PSZ9_9GAMM|nr:ABC transporter permease subunit [Halomonas gudaonensis]SDI95335.1 Cu-processing system permease protein [Halomonas gudaonensis]
MNHLVTVAGKEFRDGLRNRWVLAITLVFGLLAIGLAYFGAAASGQVGFTGVATTIVSLSSLAVFLIPLIALLLAYDSIVGEDEQGTLLLLLTYPISRVEILAGKFLGHAAILGVSTLVGFGVAGLVIAAFGNHDDLGQLLAALALFILSATLLGWAFIGFAYLISVSVSEKSRAAGIALVVWFAFVLVFDLLLLALLVGTGGEVSQGLFHVLLLLNPADIFRILNLTFFEAARTQAGLASLGADAAFHPALLLGALSLWVAAPLGAALWIFRRREA